MVNIETYNTKPNEVISLYSLDSKYIVRIDDTINHFWYILYESYDENESKSFFDRIVTVYKKDSL